MMSIRAEVSDGISAANGVTSIWVLKPWSCPIALMMSTITPWMVLVLTSRKVNRIPGGVDPTF